MTNINDIILESLSDHFKKHWKKYALGATLAGIGAGGYAAKDKIKNLIKPKKTSFGKKLAIGAGLMGAGLGYVGNKAYHGIKGYNILNSAADREVRGNGDIHKHEIALALHHFSQLPNFIGHKIVRKVGRNYSKNNGIPRAEYDELMQQYKLGEGI